MTKKRKSTSTSVSTSKRPRNDSYSLNDDDNGLSANGVKPRLDPTYGQRGAFPGLDGDGGDEELFYGPAEDGLEYLRMVRSEAKTVPNLLVAPKAPALNDQAVEQTGGSSGEGYYEDGAYTAAPLHSSAPTRDVDDEDPEDDDQDPQEAYYASLHSRFLDLRSHLHSQPPSSPALISQPLSQASTHAKWRYSLLHTQPTMVQLGSMRQETVMRGLRVLESVLTVKNLGREAGVGAWAWGLLARCRESGEMGSEDVGLLRDVGKRAVWVLRGLRGGTREAVREESVDVEGDDRDGGVEEGGRQDGAGGEAQVGIAEDGEDESGDDHQFDESEDPKEILSPTNPTAPRPESEDALARAKQSLLSALQRPPSPPHTTNKEPSPPPAPLAKSLSTSANENDDAAPVSYNSAAATLSTHAQLTQRNELDVYATLDMIITIVGEFYGQRDLHEGRDLWDEVFEAG